MAVRRIPEYLMILIFLVLLLAVPWSPAPAARSLIGDRFAGETMDYDIGFWLFNPFGSGKATLQPAGNGKYFFSHEAEACGFIGVITGYRREIHRSLMSTMGEGRRFFPLSYEHQSVVGDWSRKRSTVYDYASGKMITTTEISGEPTAHKEIEIPGGPLYDSPVTAFYNFRFGVYGKVEPGREFHVPLSPKPKDVIHLILAPADEAEKKRQAETRKEGKDLFLTIRLDKSIIGSREINVWLNKDGIPVSGVIKALRFFGDITGTLTHYEGPDAQ